MEFILYRVMLRLKEFYILIEVVLDKVNVAHDLIIILK